MRWRLEEETKIVPKTAVSPFDHMDYILDF